MDAIGKIGVLLPEILDSLEYELLDGIHMHAKALGYDVLIFSDTYNAISDYHDMPYVYGLENIYQLAFMGQLDGILYAAGRFRTAKESEYLYRELKKLDIPCLVLEQKNPYFPYINAPQRDSIKMVTEHLIYEHGCRSIYCMTGLHDDLASEERLAGYLDAMNEAGLPVDESMIFYGNFWIFKPEELAHDIASGKVPKPDAVVCVNDIMATSLCSALEEHGISVPDEIAVTGYDGGWTSILNTPRVTTVTGREYDLGARAVCRLYEMMTGKSYAAPPSFQYMRKGTSCGCTAIDTSGKNHFISENYLKRMVQRYFDRRNYLNSDFISHITTAGSADELMQKTNALSYILHSVEWLDVCLCEDWMFDFEDPEHYRREGFSQTMLLALSKRTGTTIDQNHTFPVSDILPFFRDKHEPQLILLTSLHHQGQIFGYIASTYRNANDIFADAHYVNWCDSVASGLFILQNKMYRDYISQQFASLSVHDLSTGLYNKRGFMERLPVYLGKSDCILMLISYPEKSCLDKSDVIASHTLIANALRLSSENNELIGRLENNVFASVHHYESDDTEAFAENQVMLLEEKIREFQGGVRNPQIPELMTDCIRLSLRKMNEIEACIEERLQLISGMTEAAAGASGSYIDKLYRLHREIYSSPQENWNLPDMAKKIGISISHFQKVYKEEFGTSCVKDIINARIEKAKWLLLHTELRVQEIAAQCGYSDNSHFMRQFKEKTGMSALKFRG